MTKGNRGKDRSSRNQTFYECSGIHVEGSDLKHVIRNELNIFNLNNIIQNRLNFVDLIETMEAELIKKQLIDWTSRGRRFICRPNLLRINLSY
jgi:hypothetical protein